MEVKLAKDGQESNLPTAAGTGGKILPKLLKKERKGIGNKTVAFDTSTKTTKIDESTHSAQNPQWTVNMIEEKVLLMQRVEQAERTVAALEEQLYNNSRQWAKERTAMQRSFMMGNNNNNNNMQNSGFPQKMITSRPYHPNENFNGFGSYHENGGTGYTKNLQFPPYSYHYPGGNS